MGFFPSMKVFPYTTSCRITAFEWRTNIYNVTNSIRKLKYQNDKSIEMEKLIQINNVGKKKMNKMISKCKGCMCFT